MTKRVSAGLSNWLSSAAIVTALSGCVLIASPPPTPTLTPTLPPTLMPTADYPGSGCGNPSINGGYTLSPDGKQVAFGAMINGQQDLFIVNIDGTRLRHLTHDAAGDSDPVFSPDGERIAWTSEADNGELVISIINPDGTERIDVDPGLGSASALTWSPDGTQIVLQRSHNANQVDLVVIDSDGGAIIDIRSNGWINISPAWSPDGSQIAFLAKERRGLFFGLFVMSSDGGNARPIQGVSEAGLKPLWMNGGQQIATYAWRDNALDIINPDGTGLQRVVNFPDQLSGWWPASSGRIWYTLVGSNDVMSVTLNSPEPRREITVRGPGGGVIALPSGRKALYVSPVLDGRTALFVSDADYITTQVTALHPVVGCLP